MTLKNHDKCSHTGCEADAVHLTFTPNGHVPRCAEHKGPQGITLIKPKEPAWITDCDAQNVDIDASDISRIPMMLEKIVEGEIVYCDHCGEAFPMWPLKGWAGHVVQTHAKDMTIQAHLGTSQLCQETLTMAHQGFISNMFRARVSIRRRAWQLGYMVVKPGRIVASN